MTIIVNIVGDFKTQAFALLNLIKRCFGSNFAKKNNNVCSVSDLMSKCNNYVSNIIKYINICVK